MSRMLTVADTVAMFAVLDDVANERDRQEQIGEAKRAQGIDWRSCADPDMAGGDFTRFTVLGEEFGEVANAVLETAYGSDNDRHLREELVQVAAVAVAWCEAIDRRVAAGGATGDEPLPADQPPAALQGGQPA